MIAGRTAGRIACALVWTCGAAFAAYPPALPELGTAPQFRLAAQNGKSLALADLRGKVVLVTFLYTSCRDVCLTETSKMVYMQNQLGEEFGRRVYFVSITLDPEHDSAAELKRYAELAKARLSGWSFLTGTPAELRAVAGSYGVVSRRLAGGEIEHNTTSTLVDARGHQRVQYLGVAFDPAEMLADIRALVREGGAP